MPSWRHRLRDLDEGSRSDDRHPALHDRLQSYCFLTALLSYVAVVFHLGLCEKFLRYGKLATSSSVANAMFYAYVGRRGTISTADSGSSGLSVWSKNSCGLSFVAFEQPAKPFSTLNRAISFAF